MAKDVGVEEPPSACSGDCSGGCSSAGWRRGSGSVAAGGIAQTLRGGGAGRWARLWPRGSGVWAGRVADPVQRPHAEPPCEVGTGLAGVPRAGGVVAASDGRRPPRSGRAGGRCRESDKMCRGAPVTGEGATNGGACAATAAEGKPCWASLTGIAASGMGEPAERAWSGTGADTSAGGAGVWNAGAGHAPSSGGKPHDSNTSEAGGLRLCCGAAAAGAASALAGGCPATADWAEAGSTG